VFRLPALIVCLCLLSPAAPARAQMQTSDETNPTKLYTALIAAAGDRFDLDLLPLSLSLQDDQVAHWSISLPEDDAALLAALTEALPYAGGIEQVDSGDARLEAPLLDRLIEWSRLINDDLAPITAREFKNAGRNHYNPELDYEFSVSGHVLPVETYGEEFFYASFDHHRLAYLGRPARDLEWLRFDDGFDQTDPQAQRYMKELQETAAKFGPLFPPADPPVPSGESELTWTILPSKTTWSEKEEITGRITLHNTGKRRIHVNWRWGPSAVDIRDSDGGQLKKFRFNGCMLYCPPDAWNYYLLPGAKVTRKFTIYTDPENCGLYGYRARPGRYTLTRPPIDNVIMRGDPVTIEVKSK